MAATISELLDRVDNAPDILDAIPELERCVRWKRVGRTAPDRQILQVMVFLPTGIYGWEILTEDPEADNWKFPGWPPVSASEVNRTTWGQVWTFLQDVASDPERKRGAGWVKHHGGGVSA
jgi:hypothetical protein